MAEKKLIYFRNNARKQLSNFRIKRDIKPPTKSYNMNRKKLAVRGISGTPVTLVTHVSECHKFWPNTIHRHIDDLKSEKFKNEFFKIKVCQKYVRIKRNDCKSLSTDY